MNQKTIRVPLQFLLICVFFLLYDIELVFVFPLVAAAAFLGFYDFLLSSLFFSVFFVSLVIDFVKHALAWQY
jgi:NADH:ubiquinone oxidoreductase subunit 3 (subunit A)